MSAAQLTARAAVQGRQGTDGTGSRDGPRAPPGLPRAATSEAAVATAQLLHGLHQIPPRQKAALNGGPALGIALPSATAAASDSDQSEELRAGDLLHLLLQNGGSGNPSAVAAAHLASSNAMLLANALDPSYGLLQNGAVNLQQGAGSLGVPPMSSALANSLSMHLATHGLPPNLTANAAALGTGPVANLQAMMMPQAYNTLTGPSQQMPYGGNGGWGNRFKSSLNLNDCSSNDVLAGLNMHYDSTMVQNIYAQLVQVHYRHGNVVAQAAKCLPGLDSQAFSALLKALGKRQGHGPRHVQDTNMHQYAFDLFDFVVQEARYHRDERRRLNFNMQHHFETLLDTYSYTTIISLSTGSRENSRRACMYFQQMREMERAPNAYTYTAMMSIMLKVNDCEKALDYYQDLLNQGLTPTLVTNKIALDANARTDRWDEALRIWILIQRDVEPDIRLCTLVFMTLGRQSLISADDAADMAIHLFERMQMSRMDASTPMIINLIRCLALARRVDDALHFFDKIRDRDAFPAVYNALAFAYDGEEAERLRDRARQLTEQASMQNSNHLRNGQCTSWDGRECFFEALHGVCKYGHTHRSGISNRPPPAPALPPHGVPGHMPGQVPGQVHLAGLAGLPANHAALLQLQSLLHHLPRPM